MQREHQKWYSPALGREMEMLVFGHYGRPMLVFPSAQGRFFDYECNHMIETIRGHIEGGKVKVFCVDGVDSESWFNKGLAPDMRVRVHQFYEQYITHEVFPFIHHHCGSNMYASPRRDQASEPITH
jgi:esterase/lipase superfamily enzyme